MKKLYVYPIGVSLLLVSPVGYGAQITIPDGSIEGISKTLNPPLLLGTSSTTFGAWQVDFTGLLSLGGSISAGNSLGGPTPDDGTYDLAINLPGSLFVSANIQQTLAVHYIANSTYVLSAEVDQGSSIGLGTTASLRLYDGTNLVASLPGNILAINLDTTTGFQTVMLTYKTGNVAPTNNIGIALHIDDAVSLSGPLYVDNFRLSVNPIAVNVSSRVSGTNLVTQVTGAAPGDQFYVVTSTNLLDAVTNWTRISTNQCDANGVSSYSIPLSKTERYRFFRLLLP